ncbi:MFS transporter [Metallosphaera hakonensis]|uniref:MFS transporter n=1 Tax=Metallosphaera hakonensis TaxID=79601 RepID=UPI0006D02B90|nr:MFS transporter [Metallosphaera hakonensis]
MNGKITLLTPYWFLLFTIGFGWFLIAPLVPDVISTFHASLNQAILLISIYGYAVVIVGLIAGFISAKFSVRLSLYVSAVLTLIGFLGRIFSTTYLDLLLFQTISAIGYPMAIAPVGGVVESVMQGRSHTLIGVSVGILFGGMSAGSLLGPYFSGLNSAFLASFILSIVSLVLVFSLVRKYTNVQVQRSLRGSFAPRMILNWYVGLAVASLSVGLGGIASEMLGLHHVPNAEFVGGEASSLTFIGSAVGAIVLPTLFENLNRVKLGLIVNGFMTLVSAVIIAYTLVNPISVDLILASYFLYGFFGNSLWSMSLASLNKFVSDPSRSGLATSMFSVVSNLGVALIPGYLGGLFVQGEPGIIFVGTVEAVAFILSFFL